MYCPFANKKDANINVKICKCYNNYRVNRGIRREKGGMYIFKL